VGQLVASSRDLSRQCRSLIAGDTPAANAPGLQDVRTAYLYCFLLPFGLVGTIDFTTPVDFQLT
jgi:predicted membrane chloride channel (bestrophin family)